MTTKKVKIKSNDPEQITKAVMTEVGNMTKSVQRIMISTNVGEEVKNVTREKIKDSLHHVNVLAEKSKKNVVTIYTE